jgi:TolA-binding protein
MKTPSDHWRALAEAETVDTPLQPDEQAFLDDYDGDEDVELERDLFDRIASLGEPGPVREDDRARAEATLGEFRARQGGVSRWGVAGIAGVLAIAAAAALWIVAKPSELTPAMATEAQVSEGTFMLAESRIESGEAVPGGEWVRTSVRSCIDIESSRACFDPGSELRILDGVVELREGWMHVDEGSVSLMEDEGIVSIEAGESREVAREQVAKVVEAPKLERKPAVAPTEEIAITETDDAPRKSKPRATPGKSAGQMLSEARQLANKGKLGDAVTAYGSLRRVHPGSPESHAANVSIGQLQLRRGKASAALEAFDRYLQRGGGGLGEEARWGRVEALQRMGKKSARDKAIDKLLAAHPHSVYAPKAKALRGR